VNVGFRCSWDVIIDDVGNLTHIDTACRNVSGNQDLKNAGVPVRGCPAGM
jgi:hypothetical protein